MKLKLLAVAALVLMAIAVTPAAYAQPSAGRPEVSEAVRFDVSPPLRDLARRIVRPSGHANREVPNKVPFDLAQRYHPTPGGPDPVVQSGGPAVGNTPTPLISFDGLSDDDNAATVGFRVVPPDTQGDVGLTHYVQAINSILAVYTKTGTRIFGPVATSALWSGFGGICETNNDGDPIVLYDDAANRWLVSQFAIGADGHQCIAISTTADPTGSYHRYDFNVSPGTFNDYPKLGVWSDGYYMTANQFNGSFQGAIAVAFERDKMLLGQPAQMVKFGPLACGTDCPFSVQPSHWEGGTAPPAGSPNTFVQSWDDEVWGSGSGPDGYRLWDFTVSWTSPGSSSFVARPQVNAPEFDAEFCRFSRGCLAQPRPGEKLDALGQFTMFRAQYRNFGTHESIVVNHTVDVTGRSIAGVRWAELRDNGGGWVLHQTGTISPNGDNRWLGSIAMDKQGNIAVGYSVTGKTVAPSIRYVTRNAGDPLGTMGGEVTLHAGVGVQQSSSSRWGDYSAMSVDPADNCTFWFTQEYYGNNGSFDFKTRIGAFRVPGCV
ncbi:MAG TPA: hypothetical protein VF756_27470 [Thermoanaerobaculia bacterium]